MKIQFCGANHEVTGSCHFLQTSQKKILVDCGMFQGGQYNEVKNFDEFPFDPKEIDILLVTHGHLDHVGRIPKLIKEGFNGKIIATKATIKIMELVMTDAAKIMKYNHRKFQYPVLYRAEDIEATMKLVTGVDYNKNTDIGDGIKVLFKDAGHIFGSSFIELEADGKRIGFSGDIGNDNVPILRDTQPLGEVDLLVCESTYGDRIHETKQERDQILLDLIKEGCKRGGVIMMPAFSIERTQEILYHLHELAVDDKILPQIPMYVDSPLAINVSKVFKQFPEYYDEEASKHYTKGEDFLHFPNLTLTPTKEESIKINNSPKPKLIIAGAGMMNGGRILHHAQRYLPDPNSTLIIVGYQAHGTTGRRLYEGADKIKIFNHYVDVKCTIKAIGALSGHGDQSKLMNWVKTAPTMPKKVYFVHGEPHAAETLGHKMRDEMGIKSYIPEYKEVVDVE
ncbi:MAG: MBL fold metallo-hydrolase [Candidatus Magasanikbacteria bacterium]|jgi:metallo-beta-lactamase family protein|nr:MBL fold metallo-hydrolase [Candidatus Magasanikbacteria bacterium]MBT4221084.1 MBL fold metallo-hydrolase [Candidatus Magasanikbacteria bacterium]MBT4350572.1 MBL fold metallo-hydrolase [Candidatus Magasanikbacteria bacterium]MBT4542129.1 MBL fold metallo-hydrolase [Candidatus Magasanikbacteria bacterium]MBT6253251.1 MBL fold metallo-hydrolase [Candidatus Magasanikbacteria bacterium]